MRARGCARDPGRHDTQRGLGERQQATSPFRDNRSRAVIESIGYEPLAIPGVMTPSEVRATSNDGLRGVPREQKMLTGHLPRVIYHQMYNHTKIKRMYGIDKGLYLCVKPSGSYRGTSLIRNPPPLGPYCRPVPRALWLSQEGGRFLTSEVPLYGGVRAGTHLGDSGRHATNAG